MALGINAWRRTWGARPARPFVNPTYSVLNPKHYMRGWPQPGQQPFNGGARVPAAPRLPALNPVASGGTPIAPGTPAPAPDPLDAQYYNDVAQEQFRANQQIAQLNALSQNEKAALGENLRLLGEQQPVLQQNATNRANLSGLLYSGTLGRQIGDLQTNFVRQQARLNDTFGQHEASRRAQIEGINQQLGFDDLAARLAAIERASQAAQGAPLDPGGAFAGPSVPVVRKTAPGRPRRPARPVKPSPRITKRRGR